MCARARERASERVYVRVYICRGCCNINERIKIDTGEWAVGSRLICCKKFESQLGKTNKVAVRPEKTQISLGIRPVWSASSLCVFWVAKDPMILHADIEDSYQTGRMTRLIWVFAGCTFFVGFVMRRLICNLGESNERARFGVLLASLRSFFASCFIYIWAATW